MPAKKKKQVKRKKQRGGFFGSLIKGIPIIGDVIQATPAGKMLDVADMVTGSIIPGGQSAPAPRPPTRPPPQPPPRPAFPAQVPTYQPYPYQPYQQQPMYQPYQQQPMYQSYRPPSYTRPTRPPPRPLRAPGKRRK